MKERPILFTPENAQKCHDGTKTQTRRIIKLNLAGRAARAGRNWHLGDPNADKACPYGVHGDRLWVREPFCIHPLKNQHWYKGECRTDDTVKLKWTPSIHMPRWACRTVLEITEIRVQRLQEISEEDAKAEGAQFHDGRGIGHSGWRHDFKDVHADARSSFVRLWESINGAGSWAENPWVWAITFKKVT